MLAVDVGRSTVSPSGGRSGRSSGAGDGGGSGAPPGSSRPLLVSDRAEVIDDLVRLAAATGVELDVRPDLAAARSRWREAPLVVVDDACVTTESGARTLPVREGVVLVTRDLDDAAVWRHGVEVGAEHVVVLPDAEPWLVEQLSEARDGRGVEGRLVCTVGGRGGSGATTLAAALAVTAVGRGLRTTLVDLDPLGGGIDLVLGGEDVRGLRWPDLTRARGRINGAALRDGLPSVGELPVLAWDREDDTEVPYEAARAVVDAAVRASDLVVVDLPRATGQASSYVCGRSDALLLVVPAEVRAVVAAERVLRGYRPLAREVSAVVRLPSASGLTGEEIATALELPLAAELRPEPGIAAALDRGESPVRRPRGPLATTCRALLDRTGSGAGGRAVAG
jgi:secretion/DNA translocation related CpaE-like protein